MKLFGKHHLIISAITFVILFLMNYIGSDFPDRLYRALLTAIVSVIGLGIGLWIYSKKDNNDHPDFD